MNTAQSSATAIRSTAADAALATRDGVKFIARNAASATASTAGFIRDFVKTLVVGVDEPAPSKEQRIAALRAEIEALSVADAPAPKTEAEIIAELTAKLAKLSAKKRSTKRVRA